ncbi:YitT family protein [Lacticaseibacillus nasuensis]|uniref:DUF2179 domain-containing protein n=1 Tax=Lacticaseibacillus nasuensis JCM 17158 TaxID=1291734 RepID=A0A0R1JRM0_9LACO|nr:YitT family protein [Lacticaseibacillus nasuensis]KRK70881.1 hypothetical protein FD02_GL000062 [Lacticaseibacillus nasuensis JCM 17158]
MRLPKPISWVRGGLMLLALELIAISINWFYAPHRVAAGGATGLAIIVQESFGVPLGLTTLLINLGMLALAWWLLDRGTTRRILAGSMLLPLLLAVTPQLRLVNDRMLAVIVGSVIFAVGVALNYRIDASSGGTTVPPLIFKKYFGIKPSLGLFGIDFVVCLLNIPVSGVEAFLLAVFAVAISSWLMNVIETGLDRKKAVYVMSPQLKMIQARLQADYGLTRLPARGGYANTETGMLLIVVAQPDLKALVRRVHQVDAAAFVLVVEATAVHGGSFAED